VFARIAAELARRRPNMRAAWWRPTPIAWARQADGYRAAPHHRQFRVVNLIGSPIGQSQAEWPERLPLYVLANVFGSHNSPPGLSAQSHFTSAARMQDAAHQGFGFVGVMAGLPFAMLM